MKLLGLLVLLFSFSSIASDYTDSYKQCTNNSTGSIDKAFSCIDKEIVFNQSLINKVFDTNKSNSEIDRILKIISNNVEKEYRVASDSCAIYAEIYQGGQAGQLLQRQCYLDRIIYIRKFVLDAEELTSFNYDE
ncbi:hypothetical protein [Vibrio sp. AND4]|uniref:hypothetical protein n=1 Tax=Vibrio sp. AND4 TaxID=314289 RepID=UPI00015EFFC7|nr:hypothetical protein [Vibrio sp. AND4]EDP59282.1 hypothetical protein AND4_08922 [Vibrio sp. AND4]